MLNNNEQMPRSMLLNSLVAMPIISDGIKRRASRAMVRRINFYLTIFNCIEIDTLLLLCISFVLHHATSLHNHDAICYHLLLSYV